MELRGFARTQGTNSKESQESAAQALLWEASDIQRPTGSSPTANPDIYVGGTSAGACNRMRGPELCTNEIAKVLEELRKKSPFPFLKL
jgi:hypothetical protein